VIEGYAHAPAGVHPPLASPEYRSTRLRAPSRPALRVPPTPTEVSGPVFGRERLGPHDHDLTRQHDGDPIGQRIIVTGRVLDAGGHPITGTLVEVWQANASGRYRHVNDNWPGTLDPNFSGGGRVVTDADGTYRFVTIRPGAYPWGNHRNAWRPAHIHFSLFGRSFSQRLVTQMYFPDDPLFFQDPILGSIPDESARRRLVCRYDHEVTEPEWALGYRFDIVLRGPDATPFEAGTDG